MQSRVTVVFSAAVLVGVAAFAQQPVPAGSEFHVNTYTTDGQYRPSVASGPDGDFIVVWSSRGSSGTDTDGESIQGQRYSPGGIPAGNEFQVNTFTTYWQWQADIGRDAAGNFVVVWIGPNSSNADEDRNDIFGQRFAANGAPVGVEFPVNSYTTDYQLNPTIAVAPDGSFVVAWDGQTLPANNIGIRAQRFAADATPLGNEFQVNTYLRNNQRFPSIAMNADGDFIVVWESDGSAGSDEHGESVQGQRFAANGILLGGEFQVNSYTTDSQYRPSVAMDTDGDFVVVWESLGSFGSDTFGKSVQGQRFAADGTPLGSEFQVNSYTDRNQRSTAVAMASAGAFVVVWESYGSDGTDVAQESIQMRRFSSDGRPVGEDFQVNTYTPSQQWNPAVSVSPGREFVVVYQSRGDDPSNPPFGIRGQRFEENLLFSSGLEFGDTSDWPVTVP
ncbi:MAG: hypothetical protein GWP16_03265 [Nitrospirae bacterium]|nr:hypothetical protein [Nitrospirota bacterium]